MSHISLSRASSSSGSGEEDVASGEACKLSSISSRRPAGVGKARKLVPPLKVDLSSCKYELFRLIAGRLGWQLVPEGSSEWDMYWTDTSISQERLINLKPTQRINHFHGMLELCRKRSMAKHLSALAALIPPELKYDFFPQTWQLPGQLNAFLAAAKAAGKKQAFIVKPDAGCQGKGIKLVQGGPEATVLKHLAGLATLEAVAQQYMTRPFLINGLKFDLRVYVLVTDVDPLRLFIYKEGLVRFCTTPYKKPTSKNLDCAYMHLTNYAVNKTNSDAFVAPADSNEHVASADDDDEDSSASKWTFLQLRQYLESQGHSWCSLWDSIGQLIVKSLLSVAPHLAATYRASAVDGGPPTSAAPPANTSSAVIGSSIKSSKPLVSASALAAGSCRCFEVLGYDVLLDADLRPWLIEVNHSPSFNIDSPLDRAVKEQLILDAVHLVRIDPSSIAAAKKAAKKATQMRLLGPAPTRDSSSLLAAAAHHGGASPDRVEQRAYREMLTAARDRWQDRHLGAFERLYPVSIAGQLKASNSSTSSQQSAADVSAAKLGQLQELQDCYNKILRLSQQLYQGQIQQQQQGQSPPRSPVKVNTFRAGCSPGRLQGSPLRSVAGNNSSSSNSPSRLARQAQQPGAASRCTVQQGRPVHQQEGWPANASSSSDESKRSSRSDDADEVRDTASTQHHHTSAEQDSRPISLEAVNGADSGNAPGSSSNVTSGAVESALAALSAALAATDEPLLVSRPRSRPYSASGGIRPASSSASLLSSTSHTGSNSFAGDGSSSPPIRRPMSANAGASSSLLQQHQPYHPMMQRQQSSHHRSEGNMPLTTATAAKARPQSAPRSDSRTDAGRSSSNSRSRSSTPRPYSAAAHQFPCSKYSDIIHSTAAVSVPQQQHAEASKKSASALGHAAAGVTSADPAAAGRSLSAPRSASSNNRLSRGGPPAAVTHTASRADMNAAIVEANAALAAVTAAAEVSRAPEAAVTGSHNSPAPGWQEAAVGRGGPGTHHTFQNQQEQQSVLAAGHSSASRPFVKSHTFNGATQSQETRRNHLGHLQTAHQQHTSTAGQLSCSSGSSRYLSYVSSESGGSRRQQVSNLLCNGGALQQQALSSMKGSSLGYLSIPKNKQPVTGGKVESMMLGVAPDLSNTRLNSSVGHSLQTAQEIAGIGVQLADRSFLRGTSTGGLLGRLRLQDS